MKLKWTQFDGELGRILPAAVVLSCIQVIPLIVIDPEGLKTTDKAPQTSGDTNRNKENELPISL